MKLDVYRLSLDYIQWVYNRVDKMMGIHRHARDQLLRASQSIPLNIAEGNGKFCDADRLRFFAIARGSTLECAAIQDVLLIGGAINNDEYNQGEQLLFRIACMLTKMTKASWKVQEEQAQYIAGLGDNDNDIKL